MNAKVIMKQKKRNQLKAQQKTLNTRRRQLMDDEKELQKRASTEAITEELEQEVEQNAEELAQVETEIADLQEQIDAIDEELASLAQEEPAGDEGAARSAAAAPSTRSAQRTVTPESGSFRSRSNCFSSRAARDGFYQRSEVKAFLDRVRELGGSGRRSVKGADLTIPDVMLELLRDNVDKTSKLISKVRLRSVGGNARQNIMGKVPEGVWMEMCGKLNELEFAFNQIEVDGYKVGGFIPVCNALLADSDVNLGEEIMGMLLAAIGYALDKAIVYGKGRSGKMPVGIVTRLVQTQKPDYWGANQGEWTDLHSSHVLTLNLAAKTGVEFFQGIFAALGKAEPDYASGGTVWVMNRKTHMDLIGRGLTFNAAGTLVSGLTDAMPVENGSIVELDFIPDNEIVGGYMDLYLLVERQGGTLAQSEHVRFIEDETVFKGTARYDGQPIIGEGFVLINFANANPTTAVDFAPDSAAKLNALIVTAAAGTKGTTLTVAGSIGGTGYSFAYKLSASTADVKPGEKVKGFTAFTPGTTDIEAANGTPIVVVELDNKGNVASCGTAVSAAATA